MIKRQHTFHSAGPLGGGTWCMAPCLAPAVCNVFHHCVPTKVA